MKRGYCQIGLIAPKFAANIGSAMRACGVYGAAGLFYTGKRFKRSAQFITDTQKFHRHIPITRVEDLEKVIPFGCVPVAVDLIEGAENLCDYVHPMQAMYIFGPEDSTLGNKITSFCRDKIYIPTNGCMNLAATVNVVLYDRMAKSTICQDFVKP